MKYNNVSLFIHKGLYHAYKGRALLVGVRYIFCLFYVVIAFPIFSHSEYHSPGFCVCYFYCLVFYILLRVFVLQLTYVLLDIVIQELFPELNKVIGKQ